MSRGWQVSAIAAGGIRMSQRPVWNYHRSLTRESFHTASFLKCDYELGGRLRWLVLKICLPETVRLSFYSNSISKVKQGGNERARKPTQCHR